MILKATNHNYYCNDANYFASGVLETFETWEDFREVWLNDELWIDHDYNHCFRFDIKNMFNHVTDEEFEDRFSLHLYMMLQRKGKFVPITIKEIKQGDMQEVGIYLSECWDYMKKQWAEFSK